MALRRRKTGHRGATRKAKSQSREQKPVAPQQQRLESLEEQVKKLPKRKYRIVKAISKSTDELTTGRYEGPLDPGDE
jgi:Cu/Ag efflux pump CusA